MSGPAARIGNEAGAAIETRKSAGEVDLVVESRELGWAMSLLRLLNRLFQGPPCLMFLFMGIAAGGFALCSFNLLYLFQANFNLITTYGAMAAFDGGILQLIELTAWGYLALACYVVFKGCLEGVLQHIHAAKR
jgi:hypothetical protein